MIGNAMIQWWSVRFESQGSLVQDSPEALWCVNHPIMTVKLLPVTKRHQHTVTWNVQSMCKIAQVSYYSKTCVKRLLSKRLKIVFKTNYRFMSKVFQNAPFCRPNVLQNAPFCRSKVLQNAPNGTFCDTFDLH